MSDNSQHSQQNTNEQQQQQLQGYTFIKTLGKGNFGKVKLGTHILTGQHVAIKILQKDLIFEKADIERISRQIKIMKIIRHENIIQLYQIIQKPKRLYLIMQYADGGDLFDLIVKNQRLNQKQAMNYFMQIILGLEYLHSKGITHRDMKPQNILISKNKIKIADFGLGNFFQNGQMLKTACGSPCYASPEMLQRIPYNPQKTDIWSSGIILYAMICGYLPFEDEVTTRLYQKIKNNNPRYPKFINENIKSLLKKILDKNPQIRINISQIKLDSWIKQQFQKQHVIQFQVDMLKLNKICQIYGIKEQDKLINYLKKNKHNNLTTIYYLASKGKIDDNLIVQENKKQQYKIGDQVHTGHIQVNKIKQNEQISATAINNGIQKQPDQQVIFQQTQSIIQQPTPTTNQHQPKQPSPSKQDPKIKTNPTAQNQQIKQQPKQQNKIQKQQIKSSSIKNQISFSQLQQFSNQSIEELNNLNNNNYHASQNIQQQQTIQIASIKDRENDNKIDQFNKQFQDNRQVQDKNITQIIPNEQKQQQASRQLIDKIQKSPQKKYHQIYKSQIRKNQPQQHNPTNRNFDKIKKKFSLNQSFKGDKDKQKDKSKQVKNIKAQKNIGFNNSLNLRSNQNRFQKNKTNNVQSQSLKNIIPVSPKNFNIKTNLQGINQKQQNPKKLQNIGYSKNRKQIVKQSTYIKAYLNNVTIKKQQINRSFDQRKKSFPNIQQPQSAHTINNSLNISEQQKSNRDIQKKFDKKPKLIKNSRMQIIRSNTQNQIQSNRKAPVLYQRSHSRDKPLVAKKIIGKLIPAEPFLLDVSKIVLCSWALLSGILTQRGAQGRIQYYAIEKNCIYLAKCSIKGIRNIKQLVQKINSGQIQ